MDQQFWLNPLQSSHLHQTYSGQPESGESEDTASPWALENDPQSYFPMVPFWQELKQQVDSNPGSLTNADEQEERSFSDPPKAEAHSLLKRRGRRPRSHQLSDEVLQRRRAQNRDAQRAYRDRKDRHIRELQVQLEEIEARYEKLNVDHRKMCAAHALLSARVSQQKWETGREKKLGGSVR